ncbi:MULTISPECIES: hypothetical protein [Streptomyces]
MAQIWTTSGWTNPKAIEVWDNAWLKAKSAWIFTDQGWREVFKAELGKDVSVLDFGAKGDGRTNDAAAFQAAIDHVGRLGGGTVSVPGLTFAVDHPGASPANDDPMILIKSNVHVKMADAAVIKRIVTTRRHPIIGSLPKSDTTTTSFNGPKSWVIEGGTIDDSGVGTVKAGRKTTPVVLSHTDKGTFRKVRFLNGGGDHVIDSTGNRDLLVDGCRFEGWVPPKPATNADPKEKYVGSCWGREGWPYVEAIQIDRASSDSGGAGAFDNTLTEGLTVKGCWAGPSATAGPPAVFVGSHLSGTLVAYKRITVDNNEVADCLGAGVRAISWQNGAITNNKISSRHDHPTYGKIDHGGRAGIILHALQPANWSQVAPKVLNVKINGNTLKNTGRLGSAYAGIDVNQEWHWYAPDGTVAEANDMPKIDGFTGIEIKNNTLEFHGGANFISANEIPGVVIQGNDYTNRDGLPKKGRNIYSDHWENVIGNGPMNKPMSLPSMQQNPPGSRTLLLYWVNHPDENYFEVQWHKISPGNVDDWYPGGPVGPGQKVNKDVTSYQVPAQHLKGAKNGQVWESRVRAFSNYNGYTPWSPIAKMTWGGLKLSLIKEDAPPTS